MLSLRSFDPIITVKKYVKFSGLFTAVLECVIFNHYIKLTRAPVYFHNNIIYYKSTKLK